MNAQENHRIGYVCISALVIFAAVLALPGAGRAAAQTTIITKQDSGGGGTTTVTADVVTVQSDQEGHAIEIRIQDGKVTVTRDGKEVPDAQIRHDDDRIVILDKDGKELQNIEVHVQAKPGALRYRLGSGGEGKPPLKAIEALEAAEAKPPKVMLGVFMTDPGPALERHLGLEPGKTTMISGVHEGLPAHEAGLREYDIITRIDGRAPAEAGAIREALVAKEPGDTVVFTVIHEGKTKDVATKLAAYDREAMEKAKLIGSAPQDQMLSKLGAWAGDMALLEPGHEGPDIFIAPDTAQLHDRLKAIQPQIERRLMEAMESRGGEELDAQLQRLENRMADLEQLLQKLIDRQDKGR